MFRRSLVSLRVSPFALFMQDLSKAGKISNTKNVTTVASKLYHKQTPAQMAALRRRASAMSYPKQKAYSAMVKREWKREGSMSTKQRYAAIKAKRTEMQKKQSAAAKKTAAKASSKVKAAAAKVKKAAKPAKPSKTSKK